MKKQLRRGILLAFLLVVFAGAFQAQAAGKNVTKSMSKNTGLKKIVRDITKCTCTTSTKKVTVNLSAKNMFDMAARIGANSYHQTSFTKAEIHKLTYNLFGKKPSVSAIPKYTAKNRTWISRKYLSWHKKPYVFSGGDWGTHMPRYKITKVMQVKSGVYDVTAANRIHAYETGKTTTIGTTTVRLKKNPKSSYGFVITKLTYQGNGASRH